MDNLVALLSRLDDFYDDTVLFLVTDTLGSVKLGTEIQGGVIVIGQYLGKADMPETIAENLQKLIDLKEK